MWAHIGWLIFKLDNDEPYDNVADLQRDPLVMWQDRYVQWIAVTVSFLFPTVLGYLWNGWAGALGAFLIGGLAASSRCSTRPSSSTPPVITSATGLTP